MFDLQNILEQAFDYIKGIWIKKRYMIISSWLICPVGFFYVASLQDTYSSSTTVHVDTRSMLEPLLRGLTIQTNPQQEISMILRTLKKRDNIEVIARTADLDIYATSQEAYQALLRRLSSGIRISNRGENTYRISFSHEDPALTKKVVEATLSRFVELSLGTSRRDTDSAQVFLQEQIDEYEQRLIQAETRVADFKRKYSDILPETGSYFNNLKSLESELEKTRLTIKETEGRSKSLMANLETIQQNLSNNGYNNSIANNNVTTKFDSRIDSMESKLDQLRVLYTDLHPDVIQTMNMLQELRERRSAEIQTYANYVSTDSIGNVSPVASELAVEISQLDSQIASLRVRERNFEAKIVELRDKIDFVPQLEAERQSLNRDYGIVKRKYESLVARKDSAELGEKASLSREDVQFEVLRPANLPSRPSGPQRMGMYVLILIAGFGSGLGVAFLLSQLSPVVIRAQQITSFSDYPIFGTVTNLNWKKSEKSERYRLIIFIISSGIIVSLFAILGAAESMSINLYSRVFQ